MTITDETIDQVLDAIARARSTILTDRVALIDSCTDSDGNLDEEAEFARDEYDQAIAELDRAADSLIRARRAA